MKIAGRVIEKNEKNNIIIIEPYNKGDIKFFEVMQTVEIITDPTKKHAIRAKIFSLINYLWDKGIYEIFGEHVKDSMRKAIELRRRAHGAKKASDMYRYNIYLQCAFTTETVALVPDGEGGFVRMFCEVAKSMANASGVTYEDLLKFWQELEYITAYHCGEKVLYGWDKYFRN